MFETRATRGADEGRGLVATASKRGAAEVAVASASTRRVFVDAGSDPTAERTRHLDDNSSPWMVVWRPWRRQPRRNSPRRREVDHEQFTLRLLHKLGPFALGFYIFDHGDAC